MANALKSTQKSLEQYAELNLELLKKEQELSQAMQLLKEYKEYKDISKKVEKFEKKLKEEGLAAMIENDVTTLENDYIKMTRYKYHTYEVSNADSLPRKYKILAKEAEIKKIKQEVKNDFEVLHKEVPGILQKVSDRIKLTFKESLEM